MTSTIEINWPLSFMFDNFAIIITPSDGCSLAEASLWQSVSVVVPKMFFKSWDFALITNPCVFTFQTNLTCSSSVAQSTFHEIDCSPVFDTSFVFLLIDGSSFTLPSVAVLKIDFKIESIEE